MLALALEVFGQRIVEVESWPAEELARYEAYYALKAKKEKEREAERETQRLGTGQGRRAPKPATKGRRR